MFLWHEKEDKNTEGNLFEEDAEQNKEHWVAYKMLRLVFVGIHHLFLFLKACTEEDCPPITKHFTDNHFRGHIEDIMDISWSPDGKMIVSGSIDNSVIVWEVKTGWYFFNISS